jgi:hypothetical protein
VAHFIIVIWQLPYVNSNRSNAITHAQGEDFAPFKMFRLEIEWILVARKIYDAKQYVYVTIYIVVRIVR